MERDIFWSGRNKHIDAHIYNQIITYLFIYIFQYILLENLYNYIFGVFLFSGNIKKDGKYWGRKKNSGRQESWDKS